MLRSSRPNSVGSTDISTFRSCPGLPWAILAVLAAVGCDRGATPPTPSENRGSAMGSRGRSIRLRIYFLVAIPLVAMIGMLAYLVVTTVGNATSLDRTPNLVYATAI